MNNQVDRLIRSALNEDITHEDISTSSVMSCYSKGKADLISKGNGVVAGLEIFARVFTLLDDQMHTTFFFLDGNEIKTGDRVGLIEGDIRVILSGERTALNFLQRMSGIASAARIITRRLEGTGTKLLDTRKTAPNNRIFDKYAVRVGGGYNHRFNLSDGVMLKENHLAAAGGIRQAVALAREKAPFVHKIEVEVENLSQVEEALEAKVDIIMLDNMSKSEIKEAVRLIGNRALVECSGNVTLENVSDLAHTGVNYISCGALTHSSSILDFSLKNLERVS